MTKMSQIITKLILVLTLVAPFAMNSASLVNAATTTTTVEIGYKSARIRWRYKTKHGVLYRRQYNYSTETWLGKWVKA